MKRISTATMATDLFGIGKHGFKDGNLVAGIAPTDLEADWFNGVQEELLNVIEGAGLQANGQSFTQLFQAILILIQQHSGGVFIAEATSLAEETAAFAAGATMVIRLDLLSGTTTAAPTTTAGPTTTSAPTTTTTTAAPVSQASDLFTDSNGVLLSAHTSDSGHIWTRYTHTAVGGGDEPGTSAINSNALMMGDAATWSSYYISWTPPNANYKVQATMHSTTTGNCASTVLGRINPAAGTYYAFSLSGDSLGTWYLYKHVAGGETVLATGSIGAFSGANAVLALTMSGATISATINGTQVASVTDASIAAAGFAGLRGSWTGTSPAGNSYIDSFSAVGV